MSTIKSKGVVLGLTLILGGGAASAAELIGPRQFILYPPQRNEPSIVGYDRAWSELSKRKGIKYGNPILAEVDSERSLVDLSDFDDLVISVPLEELLAQPNRTFPSDGI